MSRESLSVGIGEASLAFSTGNHAALRRRSVALMIVLSIATLGLYYAIWFLRRRTALNELNSPRKLQAWPFILYLAFVALRVLVAIASSAQPHAEASPVDLLFSTGQLAIAILMIVQCFHTRSILEGHLTAKLSGLLTFFFTIFYLQHVINTRVVPSERLATTG